MHLALTSGIDVAQVVLYFFWAFFALLIIYLIRENKREGYPLLSDRTNARVSVVGWPTPPSSKTFVSHNGHVVRIPEDRIDRRVVALRPVAPWPGAPFTPTGNAMLDGVGPGSWAEREDELDLTVDLLPKIVPLRVATDYFPAPQDPDPRGMTVIAGNRKVAGTVVDAWVDRSEYIFRYYEVELTGAKRRVLVPVNFAKINAKQRAIKVDAIFAHQFETVPGTKAPDQVTMLEEEKICAYFGGGLLYAEPKRTESFL